MFTVHLFLAGFNKCGSTTMSALLARHPDILLPAVTEPWYFVKTSDQMTWDQYVGQFPGWQDHAVVCDDSAGGYSSRPSGRLGMDTAVDRIHRHNPDARFLFIARDPVRRLESAFRELHDSGPRYAVLPPFGLAEAIEEHPQLLLDSCYFDCLSRFRDRFGADRVHLVYLEDLVARPAATMAGVWRFIDVDGGLVDVDPLPRENEGAEKLRDSRALRRLRAAPGIGRTLARQSVEQQDRWLPLLGLRRRFGAHVEWPPKARQVAAEVIWPDTQKLWLEYGRPAGGWPRLRELVRQSD